MAATILSFAATLSIGSIARRIASISLSIAKLPGFMDLLAGKAEVGSTRFNVLLWNVEIACTAMCRYFPLLLRGIVFIRQPHLGAALDQKCVRLGAVCGPRQGCHGCRSRRQRLISQA